LALGRVNRLFSKFSNTEEPLTEKGQRLLKGFYTANTKELEKHESDDDDFNFELDHGKITNILLQFLTKKKEQKEIEASLDVSLLGNDRDRDNDILDQTANITIDKSI
jgi:hypothetical protein